MSVPPFSPAFSLPVRVYYEDTDAAGVVYYANYLKFFERCRTEWMRQAGHDPSELAREQGIAFVVSEVVCRYHRPARLDDLLTVGLAPEKTTGARISLLQSVARDGKLLASGTVLLACIQLDRMRPFPIPEFLHRALNLETSP